MRILWVFIGAVLGLLIGAAVGFGAALVAMSLGPPRYDGSYGMREMLICLPMGALLGAIAGIAIGMRFPA